MDSEQKKLLTICASYIAVPRLMFLGENYRAAMDDVLNDSIKKSEILIRKVEARWPSKNGSRSAQLQLGH
jgi:hypothetical protein